MIYFVALTARVSTARKLSKIIYHLMKDCNVQILRRPQDSQENISKDMVKRSSHASNTIKTQNFLGNIHFGGYSECLQSLDSRTPERD